MRRVAASLVLLAAALGLLAAAGGRHPRLLELRRAHRLNQADPLENTPPLVAFTTVALGGFRGILADVLWMRASTLQDEGRYFELVQLADWIVKLQPRFASVWAFHAWNLSYNISVMLDRPEDRWRWVRHGVALLRDEGLRYNPGSATLYRELAWLFAHKIGQDLDQAHLHYKREWADEMARAFAGDLPPPAHPPDDRAALLADPAVAGLVRRLSAAGSDPFDEALLDEARRPAAAGALLGADPAAPALLAFLRGARRERLYGLRPADVAAVERVHGPLDWRLPQAHAVYWSYRGLAFARSDFERLSLQRMIFQSMADAFLRGRLVRDEARGVFATVPNLALLPRVRGAYEQALREHPGDETVQTAHRNFLVDAAMISFSYNREREAREIHAELVRRYPAEAGPGGFEAFVARTYAGFLDRLSTGDAAAVVESACYQAAFWRALGEEEQAAGYERLARLCWARFMSERDTPEFRERTGLPPIEEIEARARARAAGDLRRSRGAAAPAAP